MAYSRIPGGKIKGHDIYRLDGSLICFYSELGISESATQAQISKAYYKLALIHHPDKSSAPNAPEKMRNIKAAQEILCNADSLKEYKAAVNAYQAEQERKRTQELAAICARQKELDAQYAQQLQILNQWYQQQSQIISAWQEKIVQQYPQTAPAATYSSSQSYTDSVSALFYESKASSSSSNPVSNFSDVSSTSSPSMTSHASSDRKRKRESGEPQSVMKTNCDDALSLTDILKNTKNIIGNFSNYDQSVPYHCSASALFNLIYRRMHNPNDPLRNEIKDASKDTQSKFWIEMQHFIHSHYQRVSEFSTFVRTLLDFGWTPDLEGRFLLSVMINGDDDLLRELVNKSTSIDHNIIELNKGKFSIRNLFSKQPSGRKLLIELADTQRKLGFSDFSKKDVQRLQSVIFAKDWSQASSLPSNTSSSQSFNRSSTSSNSGSSMSGQYRVPFFAAQPTVPTSAIRANEFKAQKDHSVKVKPTK